MRVPLRSRLAGLDRLCERRAAPARALVTVALELIVVSIAVGAVAHLAPALRAVGVAPSVALRSE